MAVIAGIVSAQIDLGERCKPPIARPGTPACMVRDRHTDLGFGQALRATRIYHRADSPSLVEAQSTVPTAFQATGLHSGSFVTKLSSVMAYETARRVFVLLLGVFVTLSVSLSAIQSSGMSAKISMAAEMGTAGDRDCNPCDSGSDGGAKAVGCDAICVPPVVAVLPEADPAKIVALTKNLSLPRDALLLLGNTSSLDPYPPRPNDPS